MSQTDAHGITCAEVNKISGFDQQLWYLQLPHEQIVELICVVEACEGLAATRVLDKRRGIVELLAAPDLADDLERLVRDLGRSFAVERVERPEGVASIADDAGVYGFGEEGGGG